MTSNNRESSAEKEMEYDMEARFSWSYIKGSGVNNDQHHFERCSRYPIPEWKKGLFDHECVVIAAFVSYKPEVYRD